MSSNETKYFRNEHSMGFRSVEMTNRLSGSAELSMRKLAYLIEV